MLHAWLISLLTKLIFYIPSLALVVSICTYLCTICLIPPEIGVPVSSFLLLGYCLFIAIKSGDYFFLSAYYLVYYISILLGISALEFENYTSELDIVGFSNNSTLIYTLLYILFIEAGRVVASNKTVTQQIAHINRICVILTFALGIYIGLVFYTVGIADNDRAAFLRLTDAYKFENAAVVFTIGSMYIAATKIKCKDYISAIIWVAICSVIWRLAGEKFTRFLFQYLILGTFISVQSTKKIKFTKTELSTFILLFVCGLSILYYFVIEYYTKLNDFGLFENIMSRLSLQGQLEWYSISYLVNDSSLSVIDFFKEEIFSFTSPYGNNGKSLLQKIATPTKLYESNEEMLGYFAGGFPTTSFMYFNIIFVPFVVAVSGCFYGYLSKKLISCIKEGYFPGVILIGYLFFYKCNAYFTSGDFRAVISLPSMLFIAFVLCFVNVRKKNYC